MKDDYKFLTSVPEMEYEMVCQRLAEAGIKFDLRDKSESFMFDAYYANSPFGKRIYVLNSQYKEAQDLLGINDQGFSLERWRVSWWLKIIIAMFVVAWVILLFFGYFMLIMTTWGHFF